MQNTGDTKVKDTNVDAKFKIWAQQLSEFMKQKLTEVGGDEGKTLAGQVPAADPEENIPKLIAYAERAFADTLHRLVSAAEADSILEKTGGQAHQLKQLENVPAWARAGASHSQLAKDHSTSPFFGLAFAVANVADNTLVGWMKKTWGDAGPAPGLDQDFGEKEMVKDPATGKMVPKQKMGDDGRPVLKNEAGLSDWEKEARKKFLENRVEGEETVKTGVAPDAKIGPALAGMADRLAQIAQAYPVLGPIFDEAIQTIRKDPGDHEMLAALDRMEQRFDVYANSGELDDDVMTEVDVLIARAKNLVSDHAEEAEEHEGDIHGPEQMAKLAKFRGVDPKTKKAQARRVRSVPGSAGRQGQQGGYGQGEADDRRQDRGDQGSQGAIQGGGRPDLLPSVRLELVGADGAGLGQGQPAHPRRVHPRAELGQVRDPLTRADRVTTSRPPS